MTRRLAACPHCGLPNIVEHRACKRCGTPLSAASESSPSTPIEVPMSEAELTCLKAIAESTGPVGWMFNRSWPNMLGGLFFVAFGLGLGALGVVSLVSGLPAWMFLFPLSLLLELIYWSYYYSYVRAVARDQAASSFLRVTGVVSLGEKVEWSDDTALPVETLTVYPATWFKGDYHSDPRAYEVLKGLTGSRVWVDYTRHAKVILQIRDELDVAVYSHPAYQPPPRGVSHRRVHLRRRAPGW
jgi:hypothetical protein